MQCNVGGVDRWVRIVLGLLIIGAGVMYGSWWGLVGLVLLGTGVFRTCCLYKPFGISTCKVEPAAPTEAPKPETEAPAMPQENDQRTM